MHNDELRIKSVLSAKYDSLTACYSVRINDCVVQTNDCWRIAVICISPRATIISRENMRKLHLPSYSKSTRKVIGINWKVNMCMRFGINCLQTVSLSLRQIHRLNHLTVRVSHFILYDRILLVYSTTWYVRSIRIFMIPFTKWKILFRVPRIRKCCKFNVIKTIFVT